MYETKEIDGESLHDRDIEWMVVRRVRDGNI